MSAKDKPQPTVRITVLEPLGAGRSVNSDIPTGTTIGSWMGCYLEKNNRKPDDMTYKVNRNEVTEDYVLQQGDRVTMFFGKIAAAY